MGAEQERELEMIELSIDAAKKKIALGEALERLRGNADFKLLIHDEYMTNYAAHMVQNRASFGMQADRDRAFIDDQITGIGHLGSFFRLVFQQAAQAADAINEDEATREEILREDV